MEGIVAYNKYMGGVDRHDHLRANYTIQRPGHRWWRYFVWFLIDVSLVNSYILFKMCRKSAISHKQFRLTVAKQLVGGYSMRSHRARQKEITELDRTQAQHHTRTVFPGRSRACRLCSKRKLKTRAGRAKETRDGCAECQIYLHKDCFWQYHEDVCRPSTKNKLCLDPSTQTEGSNSEASFATSFSRQPVISTPARLRRSPCKLKFCI
ncbi:PiggyBac transposable element-derived protein 4-like [Plakobranchus ocellatus]|uniref:PiggyBac transposable element-derived protein 4-like n=1 Tax=Plakobranchus ocellatus TaxID=259542 RepID=A0AAV4BAF1_9GAST|nr:PiggyBac transposable element-derived protein 4-like [Plakobranchus ocellatus]